jgi:superfamily II RNA helicase
MIYRRSLHQTHRPTPLSFFVMTTKRLLNDVTILKEEKEEMAKQNPIKTRISLDSDSDGQ